MLQYLEQRKHQHGQEEEQAWTGQSLHWEGWSRFFSEACSREGSLFREERGSCRSERDALPAGSATASCIRGMHAGSVSHPPSHLLASIWTAPTQHVPL